MKHQGDVLSLCFFLFLEVFLPREGLLLELNRAVVLAISHRQPHLITQRTGATHRHAHGADLVLHLSTNEVLNVGATGEHLYSR